MEVRAGTGVLAAVQLDPDRVVADPTLAARVGAGAREAGVFVRPLVDGAIAVSPPLVVTPEDLQVLHDGFRAGLDAAR
jgi:adenosylmethionine-8-amino-7-oxononanoate aminotransferase